MELTKIGWAAIGAGVACIVILSLLLRSSIARQIVDRPDRANAMHRSVMPRIGGLAIVIAAVLALLFAPHDVQTSRLLSGALILAMVSVFDDRNGLPVTIRLLAHVLIAIAAAWQFFPMAQVSGGIAREILTVMLVIAMVWMTNLFNFMDGTDGLAGGMAVIGFAAYAVAASGVPGASALAHASAIIAGACLGFLVFNFPPARVFMGDAGSIPLGFLAAALGIQGAFSGLWSWWFPVLAFSPFLVDASVTLFKRTIRREKIWLPHRQHYFQRLVLSGWSHRKTALSYYLVMLLAAGSALVIVRAEPHVMLAMVAGWVIIYALLLISMEWRFALNNKQKAKQE
jgi:UDP-N-acetylmuramyl pentapeptide phosphotransferase/UDP-N-acetylglucosamine-1-phosphate transferase